MRTIETVVYTYDELSDTAKEKARDWYTSYAVFEGDMIIDDAKQMAALFGLDINQVYYSGFASQGDGACVTGNYQYLAGALKAVIDHAPLDTELHRIVKSLQDIQKKNFYRLVASITHRAHYYHSGTMSVTVEDSENQYRDIGDSENDVTQALRDFADWVYSQLEKQYYYEMSEEVVAENILMNEYEFDIDGNRA